MLLKIMKNKPKVLLVAGCSHSAGCEIFVKSSQQDPRFHTERSYRELKEKEISFFTLEI